MKKKKLYLLVGFLICFLVILSGCDNAKKQNEGTNNEMITPEVPKGEWNGSEYTNSFLGIKIKLPEGWKKYSESELEQIVGTKTSNVHYFVAIYNDQNCSIQIMGDRITTDYSKEQYITGLKEGLKSVETINYNILPEENIKIANQDFICVTTTVEVSGYKISQKYFVNKIDDYMVTIIVTDLNDSIDINDFIKEI